MAHRPGRLGWLLSSNAAQNDLDKRSGIRYLKDHGSVCMCVCIASLLAGFGVKGQPGSVGLGCEETIRAEMHESQAGKKKPSGY